MAVPRVFQSFNSLLGSIVRKKNATIVGPSKQLVGEFPPVTFERLYEYYHNWDMIKTSTDAKHQKFMGAGIKIKSNNEYFNVFAEKWWKTINAKQKLNQFFYSVFITGNGIIELQYTEDGRIGNIEHIPMQTIYRIFRDQFGNELKLVQVVDGVFKELDPQFFVHWMINNPDRQAFGKSDFNTVAAPRPIAAKVDPITGEAINPERTLRPLLDSQAILQNSEVEIKEKMGKPRLLVSAPGMPREQMNEVQKEMSDPNTDQYIWIFDKPIESAELQIQAQTKFDDYGNNVDAHIDIGTMFASNIIKNPGSFSYSGGQTPLDVLDQRMLDLQIDAAEMIKDQVLKPLAESWGFKEFDEMEVEVTFTPTVRKPTLEDIRLLDPEAVSPKERRKMYEVLNIPLDEQDYEEYENEMKQDKQDQKEIGVIGAMNNGMGGDSSGGDSGFGGSGGGKPSKGPSGSGGGQQPKSPSAGKSGGTPQPKATQAKAPTPRPFETERPSPPRTDTIPQSSLKKKKGESIDNEDIGNIIKSATSAGIEEGITKALERIPLPPKAGDNDNSSVDLYVSKGLDTPGRPEITSPELREEYGLDDRDEEQLNELPPNAPQKRADLQHPPNIQPEGAQYGPTGVKLPDDGARNLGKSPTVTPEEYQSELEKKTEGDHIIGGDTNDNIDEQSDGSFKDPYDLNGDAIPKPEVGQQTQSTHVGPTDRHSDMVEDTEDDILTPTDRTFNVSDTSKPDPRGQDQILGKNEDDEQPIVPSEGDPKDNDKEELEKSINLQQKKKTIEATPNQQKAIQKIGDNEDEYIILLDGPEKQNRDNVKPEDRDPRLPFVDPEVDNEEIKPQAQLDDTPLFEQTPETMEQTTTVDNTTHDLKNDEHGGDADDVKPIFDSDTVGDSSQNRLQYEEETGLDKDALLPNDSSTKLDNTGLNIKPDEQPIEQQGSSRYVKLEDYQKELGENPLEKEGDAPEEGMLMKPQDVQQYQQTDKIDKLDPTADTMEGENPDQGVDMEDIDPNILHTDPETGRNYTDLTDEQGNEVPDLRFDQTPDSDEKQPEVELENPIVTKDEYEAEKESVRVEENPLDQPDEGMLPEEPIEGQPPNISEDEFNAELDSKNEDPEKENPFEMKEQPKEQSEAPKNKSPKPEGEEKPKESKDKSSSPKEKSKPKEKSSQNNTSSKEPEDIIKKEEPKEKPEKKSESPKKKNKPKEDKEELEKNEEESKDKKTMVDSIITKQKELIDSGLDEDTVHQLLLDEFGKDEIISLNDKSKDKKDDNIDKLLGTRETLHDSEVNVNDLIRKPKTSESRKKKPKRKVKKTTSKRKTIKRGKGAKKK